MSQLLTIDDLLGIRQVSDAQIHPDGSPIVYIISSAVTGFKQKAGMSELWMTDGDAEARQLTAPGTRASSPRWSPDGSRLGFIGRRSGDERDQVFVLDVGWGEARAVTSCEGAVQAFQWSPDGTRIAVLVTDPEPASTRKARDAGRDQIEYEDTGLFNRIWIVDVATGDLRRVTDTDMQVWEFAWSPDCQTIAAIVSSQPYNWCWYRPRLVTIDVESGAVANLYNPPKTITRPVWSPDGSRIALISCIWSDQGMTGGDVLVLDAAGGEPENLTAGQPRSYTAVEWEPDGKALVATVVEDAQSAICRLDLDGTCQSLWRDRAVISYYGDPIFTRNRSGTRMAVVRSDPAHPADIWTFDLKGKAWRRHTDTNPAIADRTLHPLETLSWQSFDGASIHGLLMKPLHAVAGTPLPMVVLIHGGPTGVTGYDFPSHRTAGWAYLLASKGYAVLMPNPRGSMGFGTEFAEANVGDMGGGDLADILAGVDYCVAAGIADPERLGVGGWSYGGYLTSWVVTQDRRFKAAIAGATITNWTSFHGASTIHEFDATFYRSDPFNADGIYSFRSPIFHVRNTSTPVLFLHGEQDPICPVGQAHEMWRALRELGVDTKLVVYPREAHGPREREHVRDVLERVVGWVTRYV